MMNPAMYGATTATPITAIVIQKEKELADTKSSRCIWIGTFGAINVFNCLWFCCMGYCLGVMTIALAQKVESHQHAPHWAKNPNFEREFADTTRSINIVSMVFYVFLLIGTIMWWVSLILAIIKNNACSTQDAELQSLRTQAMLMAVAQAPAAQNAEVAFAAVPQAAPPQTTTVVTTEQQPQQTTTVVQQQVV